MINSQNFNEVSRGFLGRGTFSDNTDESGNTPLHYLCMGITPVEEKVVQTQQESQVKGSSGKKTILLTALTLSAVAVGALYWYYNSQSPVHTGPLDPNSYCPAPDFGVSNQTFALEEALPADDSTALVRYLDLGRHFGSFVKRTVTESIPTFFPRGEIFNMTLPTSENLEEKALTIIHTGSAKTTAVLRHSDSYLQLISKYFACVKQDGFAACTYRAITKLYRS